jgi:hypothetical protein
MRRVLTFVAAHHALSGGFKAAFLVRRRNESLHGLDFYN